MMTPTKHTTAHRARGFSLIEMLVVLAVAAVLLGLVISPLASTFNFTNRARRNVEVQDAARYAMEVMSREVADAMGVVAASGDQEPFLFYPSGTPGQGEAVVVRGTGAIVCYDEEGIEHDLPNAMVDIVLPHDALGLESSGAITQPLSLQHQTVDGTQHPIVVRYFVGLTNPNSAVTAPSGAPRWQNNVAMPRHRGQQNMYTLFRVEFDPYDKNIRDNWAVATSETTPDGKKVYTLNPRFFYDRTVASPSGLTVRAYWRKKAVAIMPTDSMDLVDFARDTTKQQNAFGLYPVTEARSLVTFNPLIVAADPAAAQGDSRQPATYKTAYGHWTGLQNDGTIPAASFTPGISGMLPRIAVYKQERDDNDAIALHRLFDSSQTDAAAEDHPSRRNRVLAWNSLKGTVEFSLPAPDFDSDKGGQVVTSIYEPLSSLTSPPPGAYISPGTEVVTVWEDDPNDPGNVSKYRPVVYSRSSSATKDIYEVPEEIAIQNGAPQQLPPPRTYIVTSGGKVIIGYPYPSVNNALQPQPVPNGHRVTISYYYQNNDPDDLVKVDYLTRELVTINLTARNYDPVTQKPITTTLSNRVRIRNTKR